jgi:hypothetical protein
MVRTYIIEQKIEFGHAVLEYEHTLKEAKNYLVRLSNRGIVKGVSILCVYGNTFGEGFHQYRMIIVSGKNGNKFKRVKYNLDKV